MKHSDQFTLICARRAKALRAIASDVTDISIKDAILRRADEYSDFAKGQSKLGFRTAPPGPRHIGEDVMRQPMESYNEHYLRQAERCGRMADAAKSEQQKVGWLVLADRWLRMIREEGSDVVPDHFDTQPNTERPPP